MLNLELVAKEILHSKLNFALLLLAVAMAIASLAGAMTLLEVHDVRTQQILADKHAETQQRMAQLEDDMRKAMLGLGFNIVILSKDQKLEDWYAQDYAASYLPEQYADRLASSKTVTVQHLLPTLQERVLWPEKKRTIILVGSRGELPAAAPRSRCCRSCRRTRSSSATNCTKAWPERGRQADAAGPPVHR